MTASSFDPGCRRCARLATFLDEVKATHPGYFCRPVPPFGDPEPRVLVVGLAPGLHGANATGRPFTGDFAGLLLYQTLFRFGFASAPQSTAADDGLRLIQCRITNAVKCLPPQNKPVGEEINNCRDFLQQELAAFGAGGVVVALGAIAHKSVIAGFGLRQKDFIFGHAAEHAMPRGIRLIDSYHCSRYNTQTRRLTEDMFAQVFARARALLG
ncbi:MAG: uracil-DNA glycosylase [Gammaproteobacteria bacterium]|jgi:uracil-DNA glycosylase family 4|nr:uracil-DNA glycosylase [Gammaproteobacteria bacterium]MCP5316787.1 uracil-DNA glycosylase [Chromatiaceae bacterium]MCB1819395.1 uracil-DNA glycosylase [Gammaproteobacteria bacterium]MCP5428917.1 uracil-DNA glycosylase [Chromatiaceae bacterium]HOP17447.1 uracil-DNA glycosylase [Gammaproteobacteria bacterium]